MELTPKQQIQELIKTSQKILITTHKNPDGDAVGATIALKKVLEKMGKEVTAISTGEINKVFSFIPTVSSLSKKIDGNREFIIIIDTSSIEDGELKLGYKHDKDAKKLSIVVNPSKGTISKENVSFLSKQPKFDLIIVLDSPDLERIGSLYDEYTKLFYETPLINIDHHPGNDHFGKVNWVDMTATSTCEILVSLIESFASNTHTKLLDEDTATALLTGIITDTGSFQNSNTTPKSFTVAAQLVASGARQQEIIKNIFKTKSLSTLKLWGTVLSNIILEQKPDFVWSYANESDIKSVGATPTELSGVIDELLKNAPGVEFACLVSERTLPTGERVLHVNLRAVNPSVDVCAIANKFGGGGHTKASAFEIARTSSFSEQTKDVIDKIKEYFLQTYKDSELTMPEEF